MTDKTTEVKTDAAGAKTEENTKVAETVSAPATKKSQDNDKYPDDEPELTKGDWILPKVELEQQESHTGEENEEVFWKHRAKLYRWSKDQSEWKERGLGEAKLLKHKQTGKIRFLLRQEKTLKIVANHYVVDDGQCCRLTPNVGSDKIWVWTVPDSAEEEVRMEQFGLRFGRSDDANVFKDKFEEAAKLNGKLFDNAKKDEEPEKET